MSITLTIFSPTYNRADTLLRLYQSLRRQSSNDFCWMIIDDGSTDNTEQIVYDWKNENNAFDIIYIKKKMVDCTQVTIVLLSIVIQN